MGQNKRGKRWIIASWMLALGLFATGCATVPPQPITGQPAVTQTEMPLDVPDAGADGTDAPTGAAAATPQPAATGAIVASVPPTQVELFYSGMPSMMGFADASQSTIYENVMDALPACVSLCWPSASSTFYRYGADIAKDAMRMGKDQLLTLVGDPSFYRDIPMFTQPARLKREGMPLNTDVENMNEPIRSFYEVTGIDMPTMQSNTNGTPIAVNASDEADTSLTLIVTDLHELRMDDGALLTAINEHCLAKGRTVGVVAIKSEFAGYIPDLGANSTTFAWGSPPSGTLDYKLDFVDYQVGVSVDPEHRETKSRPFYVLCIGEQNAVNQYIQTLADRLTREFAGNSTFALETAVFGSGYVPSGYSAGSNMRYIQGQGVTAIPEPSAQGGVNLIELKASQQERFLQWELDFKVHPADPRGLSLSKDDFTFVAEAVAADGTTTVLPQLDWEILSASGDTVTMSLRLELPAGILPQGSYTLELIGSLTAPSELPGASWLPTFGYDADGTQLFDMEQNTTAFDGSRTLFLSRLIDTLGKANLGRLGVAPLGTVSIQLTVYA